LQEVIVHTGQHFDANMSQVFFDEMEIPKPKYNLGISGIGHGAMTGQMLEKLEGVFLEEQPDLVLVYGDTNSTLAGALAATKMNIPLVHVEAGLRSFNRVMPEELNRILTDRMADLLFCPTQVALDNLAREGYDQFEAKVILTGDIMKDSVLYYNSLSKERSEIINSLGLVNRKFILATIHRQENTDDPEVLSGVLRGLNDISEDIEVVMPLHPRTKKMMKQFDLYFHGKIIEPVGYFDMLQLLANCTMVVTDSGGLQKEAYFNQKPCLIARKETEWVELVDGGFAVLTGSDPVKMKEAFLYYQKSSPDFSQQLYGDMVGKKMYEEILKYFGEH
jgi:UDP-GlcNAc3NAcA epimerase